MNKIPYCLKDILENTFEEEECTKNSDDGTKLSLLTKEYLSQFAGFSVMEANSLHETCLSVKI